jgi:hypothetical protein
VVTSTFLDQSRDVPHCHVAAILAVYDDHRAYGTASKAIDRLERKLAIERRIAGPDAQSPLEFLGHRRATL